MQHLDQRIRFLARAGGRALEVEIPAKLDFVWVKLS